MSGPKEFFNHTAGDCQAPESSSAANRLAPQNQLQATTTPRKRVVLDYDSSTKEITTRFTLRNNSNFAVAFKVHSSFESGYVAKPGMGVVLPGGAFDVTVVVNDLESVGRDIEKDKFAIDLASVDNEITAGDNINYDEKRMLFIGMTPAAKERLAFVAEEQRRNVQLDLARSHQRRVLAYLGTGALLLLGIFVTCIDFCTMSAEPFFFGPEKGADA